MLFRAFHFFTIRRILLSLILCFAPCFLHPAAVYAARQTVSIPLSIDYPFLQSVFVRQAFTQPGERAVPLDTAGGCSRIELWNPTVGPAESLIKLASNIRIQAGLPLAGTCLKMGEWEGAIEVLQQVVFDQAKGRLGMETKGFQTFSPDRKQVGIDRILSDLTTSSVNPYLNKVNLDLATPIKGIQNILPKFALPGVREKAGSWVNTLRVGQVQVKQEGILVDLLMDVETPEPPGGPVPEPATPADIDGLTKVWEDWDSFAVSLIESLIGQPVTEQERDDVLETLLDARYGFIEAAEEGKADHGFIVRQFAENWRKLGPLFRRHAMKQLSQDPSRYLSFLAVSDALASLGGLGPGLGLAVNREGLLDLSRLLRGPGTEPVLEYTSGVNTGLRSFFGLGAVIEEPGLPPDVTEMDLTEFFPEDATPGGGWTMQKSLLAPAPTAKASAPKEEMKQWILTTGEMGSYLDRVRQTLDRSSADVGPRTGIGSAYQPLYQRLVLATAWQESCWRQFIGAKNRVRPIVSYNQTSVGLMQINERVWRGIYRPDNLRWNTRYNITAGCEILSLYMRRYALKRPEARGLDQDILARSVYAMYNGGPGQFRKFLARQSKNSPSKIDGLFREKYVWAKADDFDKISICLIGR